MLEIHFYQVFFFFYWFRILISEIIGRIFNPIAELAILTGIPTKEAKWEMETHQATVEANISKCSR